MKKLPALLLAAALLFSLSACGDSALPQTFSVSSSPVSSADETPVPEETGDTADSEEGLPAEDIDISAWEGEMYACYAQLNDDERIVYCQIVAAVEQGISEITPLAEVTTDEFSRISRAVYLDQPQLFWMNNSWSISYDPATDCVASAEVEFNFLAEDLEENIAAFNAAAEEALSGTDGLTETETERAIHDWVVTSVDYETGELDQTAYGALVDHTAVCEGYTRAFQYLMMRAGIPTYVAEGDSVDEETGEWVGHAWNIVKLGDGYYNVDVTWDDPVAEGDSYIHYTYYNRTDADLSADHVRDEPSANLPACDAVEYSFENLYGMAPELGVTAEMGLTRSEAITSLEDFYQALKEDITAAGTGIHTYSYAISGDDVMDGIAASIDSGDFFSNAVKPAIDTFGLNGYSYTCSGEYIDLGSGYYYESFEITIN